MLLLLVDFVLFLGVFLHSRMDSKEKDKAVITWNIILKLISLLGAKALGFAWRMAKDRAIATETREEDIVSSSSAHSQSMHFYLYMLYKGKIDNKWDN